MTNQLEALIAGIKEQLPDAKSAWEESNQSTTTVGWIYCSNPVAIESLIAALEQKENLRAAANDVVVRQDAELQELRHRIAELEASQLAVNLRKYDVGEVMHVSGFSRDYAEGWCAGNDNAIHEIRAAGGTVQGDE